MKNTLRLSALVMGIGIVNLSANFAWANDSNAGAETIIVSANKKPKPIETIGASVKLIDRNEIEASQSVQLIDALVNTTGLSFARNGGYGQPTSIFIRGGESHDTLLVYDGIALSEPSLPAGNFDFANLFLNDIERIEVLKGPQSVLYGSDAIGGVISVVSREPLKPLEGTLNFEAGSLETTMLRARIGARKSGLFYTLAAHDFATGGISAKAKTIGGNEKDGFASQSIKGAISYSFNDRISVSLKADYSGAKSDFDGFPPPFYSFTDTAEYSKIKQANVYLGLNASGFKERLKSTLSFKSSQSDRRNFDPGVSPIATYIATSQNNSAEYFGNLQLSKDLDFVFGAQSNEQRYSARSPASWDPNPAASRASATLNSAYGEFQYANSKGVYVTFGARHDSHSTFGEKNTIRTSLVLKPSSTKSRFHINYGEGFKAPSLFQIYSDYGNPNIEPESGKALEFGITQELYDNWQVSMVGFERKSENQIDFFSCFGSSAPLCASRPFGFYENIKKAQTKGFEAETNYRFGAFSMNAGYAFIQTENRTIGSPNFGKSLARRPQNSANLGINYQLNSRLNASINYNYIGERYDNASNSVMLSAYDLIGVRASYKLSSGIEIYGRVENLLGEEYEIVRNYGTMPQTFNFGLRAEF